MALGSLPSLTEINTELGTSGQSLTTCIANAGRTGLWDSQKDFAGYSAQSIVASPNLHDLLSLGYVKVTSTITSSSAWETNPLVPSWITVTTGTGTSGTSILFNVDANTGPPRSGNIYVRLVSDNSVTDTIGVQQDGAL